MNQIMQSVNINSSINALMDSIDKPKQPALAIQIVEKAWCYWSNGFFDVPEPPANQRIARGETLGKAKYAFYLELQDCGFDISFFEICKQFSFRRYPDEDLVRVPVAPIFDQLTEKQRRIICHANGNGGRDPGYRDYFCTTDGHPDCERLVDLGLMERGNFVIGSARSRYYILTEEGARTALSDAVITREKSETIFKPRVTPLIDRSGFISLEAIKANPDLRDQFNGYQCRIYSAQWGYYWRPKASGYGTQAEAGAYDFSEALDRSHHCGPEKGIWYQIFERGAEDVKSAY